MKSLKVEFVAFAVFIVLIIGGSTWAVVDMQNNFKDTLAKSKVMASTIATYSSKIDELETELENQSQYIYLGDFRITHYGLDENPETASQATPTLNRTVAVDPSVIPLGVTLIINGKEYVAEDTGGAVKGKIIDILVESEELSEELGTYEARVYVQR